MTGSNPLQEYLRYCTLLSGRWSEGDQELVLALRCDFHGFDDLAPLSAEVTAHLSGVEAVHQWHHLSPSAVVDGEPLQGRALPLAASLEPWLYPAGCDISGATLATTDYQPDRPVRSLALYGGDAERLLAEHRLILGLRHPDFGDLDLWLVIDHQEHSILVDDSELNLDSWWADFVSWIHRNPPEPADTGPEDIPWP